MYANKPIIGVAGGIGSGKSFVAKLFGELGCLVLSADEQVSEVYRDPAVRQTLKQWWGDAVFDKSGELDRRAVAARIFADEEQKKRLEGLIHPRVAALRNVKMAAAADDAQVLAYVWDIPLLHEVGLDKECDAVVFVDTPFEERVERVMKTRGWNRAELQKRENSQMALDIKRRLAKYVVQNTADAAFARNQVRLVLSEILQQSPCRNG